MQEDASSTTANTKLDLELSAHNANKLLECCRQKGKILVLMQDNPDPDAIASAAAVRDLVYKFVRKRVTIGYGGMVGRAENRAVLRELKIDIKRISPERLTTYQILILVDTQPRSGNNALFTQRNADIVIDHHIPSGKPAPVLAFRDIRPNYGATSTILFEYFKALGLRPSPYLATALYYGILTDTMELGRETCSADIQAFQELVASIDRRKLAHIRRAPLSPFYFQMLYDSLSNAIQAGKTVITRIHSCDNPDMLAEVAEMMLRLEGVRSSVCYGAYKGTIHISARTADARGNAATRMKRVVKRIGTGGGHRSMAGGQVPVSGDLEKRLQLVHARLLQYFAKSQECIPLLSKPEPPSGEAGKTGKGEPA